MDSVIKQIEKYEPVCEQERCDKEKILSLINKHGQEILFRECIAHLTSSALILNETFTKVLFIHHKIHNSWGWTGGHVDGEKDLLGVALREAHEETGVVCRPLSDEIVSLDAIHVLPHVRRGEFVVTHIHFNVTYFLVADEKDELVVNEDETNGVMWIDIKDIFKYSSEDIMRSVYEKLLNKIDAIKKDNRPSISKP